MPYFTDEQIRHLFTYHRPDGTKPQRYELVRDHFRELALLVNDLAPDSPEKTLAIRALQEASMWTNASIALYPENEIAMLNTPSPVIHATPETLGEALAQAKRQGGGVIHLAPGEYDLREGKRVE